MKRVFDLAVSLPALVILAPLLLLLAAAVAATSPGGPIFRQERVGRGGRLFEILKFRTMRDSPTDSQITVGQDPRITRLGVLLRSTKLDELPQLINVARGEMSLVGPRPEVPQYVARWPASERQTILSVRPGITDPASIDLRRESELLAAQDDPAHYYETVLIPQKIAAYVAYVESQTLAGDIRIMIETLATLLRAPGSTATPASSAGHSRVLETRGSISFRPLLATDARAVAALHLEAFPSFFLSDLGPRFLKELYVAFAEDPRCVSVVALQGDRVVAVAAGATDPAGAPTALARRRLLSFSLAVAPRVIRNPTLVPKLVRRLTYSDSAVTDHPAVLSSICVSTRSQGQGIGMQLLDEWCNRMSERGARHVHLTTDADDNERTIDFYQTAGWNIAATFVTPEQRRMHVMTTELRRP